MATSSSTQIDRVAQRPTRVVSGFMIGSPPPKLGSDARFAKAFPEQADEIDRYNEAMNRWWREITIDPSRSP